MKGSAAIFVIIGILILVFLGFAYYMGYFNLKKTATNYNPLPTTHNLSSDPQYQGVKEKYNLSEEQLQILSTVNPEDNE